MMSEDKKILASPIDSATDFGLVAVENGVSNVADQ